MRSYNRGGEGAAFSLQFSCYLGLITKQVMFSINLTNERGFPDIPIPIYIFILPYRIHVTSYHFLLGMCVHACVYLFIYLFTTMFNNNNNRHEKIDDTLPWGGGNKINLRQTLFFSRWNVIEFLRLSNRVYLFPKTLKNHNSNEERREKKHP